MPNQKLLTGHEVVVMDKEFVDKWEQKQEGYHHGLVRIMPHGHLYSGLAPVYFDKIYNFNFRPDDVVVTTYPKCGTTWMQEILWTMIHNPDLNNPDATMDLWLRSPSLSQDATFDSKGLDKLNVVAFENHLRKLNPEYKVEDGVMMQITELTPGRRVIKCHYPLELMPPDLLDKCKVVYVARNPLDTVVSFYHYCRVFLVFGYKNSLEDFCNDFMNNNLVLGSYWHHLQQGWEKRNHPNLEFVFFEDMKTDITGVLKRLDKFIDTNLSQKQLDSVKEHTSFSAMKSRGEPTSDKMMDTELQKSAGGVFRKGKSGNWRNELPPEMVEKLEKWAEVNVTKLGPEFKWGVH